MERHGRLVENQSRATMAKLFSNYSVKLLQILAQKMG
jgi:hypothetical protein